MTEEEGMPTQESSELIEHNGEESTLEAIKETIRLPTFPELAPKNMPTLHTVYGRGALGELRSFGGKSLAQNMERVDAAITKTKELSNVYNRNHTEWTRRMINMEFYDPWMNMRQISAEMSSRRQALNDAKYRQLENEIEMRRLNRKLDSLLAKQAQYEAKETGDGVILGDDDIDEMANIDLEILEVQVEISKMQEGMIHGMSYIEGAMKEVLILEDLYDQLNDQINEEGKGFSEVEWEDHNARAHLRMAVAQSLRDVRSTGGITKGEQRLLEQIGVNPGVLERELVHYVNVFERGVIYDENGQEAGRRNLAELDMGVGTLQKFIEDTADKLIAASKQKSEMFGFKAEPRRDYMFTDNIAMLKGPDTETEESEE